MRDGRWILVGIVFTGVIAAMATASLMVYVAQGLGRDAQDIAASTQRPAVWTVQAAHVTYVDGEAVELHLLIAHARGDPVAWNGSITVETGQGMWSAPFSGFQVLRDDDRSMDAGVSTSGDQFAVDVPLTDRHWPSARAIRIQVHQGDALLVQAYLDTPAPRDGVAPIPVH